MHLLEVVLAVLTWIILPVSLILWLLAGDRVFRGRPILDWLPRRPVPWRLVDLVLILLVGFGLVLATQVAVARWYQIPLEQMGLDQLPPEQRLGFLLAFSVATLVTWFCAVLILRVRASARAEDLGVGDIQLARDLKLGFGAFAMLVVPVLLVQLIITRLLPTEQQHPFIELLLRNPDPRFLGLVFLAAVVVAPLSEEYLFRVILQGWLERIFIRRWYAASQPRPPVLADAAEAVPAATEDAEGTGEVRGSGDSGDEGGTEPHLASSDNPYSPPGIEVVGRGEPIAEGRDPGGADLPQVDVVEAPRLPTFWGPIVLSSALFGMAHVGQGWAPIPLFLLALGLGYLYQRTHRVLPCIIVHMLVNALAMFQLWVVLQQGA